MNIPQSEINRLQPTVRNEFLRWDDYMYSHIRFNMPDSEIHATAHCERVLMYALILGDDILGNDSIGFEILAHAAIFHDSCRQDEYLDTGHGARAAVYYEQFCRVNRGISFHPESVYLMRYHDLDDALGKEAIRKHFGSESDRVLKLYAIFKDADALDRWRLGNRGLDPEYLRTAKAKTMTDYSHRIVKETMSTELIDKIEKTVNELMNLADSEL
ncbi:hypothetical protein [uncultured Duncaniella sp.]|uniref:hypothetical protein n=1 Tax=uncultured Duncaniella sp. TaxID=2768039 RepID=UPI0025A99CDF|nr:hypothetical protein [uncultured Duncaniella sp.]